MQKSTLVKIATVVLILAFVLEAFASILWTRGEPAQPAGDAYDFSGQAAVDALVSDYFGEIIVQGANQGEKDALANYSGVLSSSDMGVRLSLKLADTENVTAVAQRIGSAYPALRLSAKAYVLVPSPVNFTSSGSRKEIPVPRRLLALIDPLYGKGARVPMTLYIKVQQGVIVDLQALEVPRPEPMREVRLESDAVITALHGSYAAGAFVPWEQRAFNASDFEQRLREKYANATVRYAADDRILLASASNESLAALQNLKYAKAVEGAALLVESNFTDRQKAESDIAALTGTAPQFPASQVFIQIIAVNASLQDIAVAPLQGALLRRVATVRLNDTLLIENKTYAVPQALQVAAFVGTQHALNDTVLLSLKAQLQGGKIIAISGEEA